MANAPTESKLLAKARDVYQAKLVPIRVQSMNKGDATWKDSYTKLLAFNQTQYKRVMSLDSDAIVREVSVYSDQSTALARTKQLI
jgi:alpha-N-acetylglucosamine transferase